MKVLYVEDSAGDADLLTRSLGPVKSDIELDWVTTIHDAELKLAVSTPENPIYDLVLADMHLPDGMGSDLVFFLKERHLPIGTVIITGLGSKEQGLTALKAGAIDYLTKDCENFERLPTILEAALARHRTEIARNSRPLKVLHGKGAESGIIEPFFFSSHMPSVIIEEFVSVQEFAGKTWSTYDLLLLDYSLAGADTLGFLKELLTTDGFNLPVVIVVNEAEVEIGFQALRLGATDYIVNTKGFFHQLPWVLENAYNKARLKKEQAALQESERIYRLVAENMNDLIWVYDVKTDRHSYVSPSVLRMTGYTIEEFKHMPIKRLVAPGSSARVDEAYQRMQESLATGKHFIAYRHDAELVRKDGSLFWVEIALTGIYDVSGSLSAILGAGRDITERKTAEEALRKSEIQLKEAMGLARLVYWEFVADKGEFIFNDPFYEFYATDAQREGGYRMSAAEYAARFMRPDAIEAFFAFVESAMAFGPGETVTEWEHWAQRRDGTEFYILNRTRILKDSSGCILRISGSNQDITERRQAEEDLKESEVKYRTVVENSLTGIIIIQDNLLIRFVNARWSEITGYSYDEVVDKIYAGTVLHPDDAERVDKIAVEVLKTGVSRVTDDKVVRKDGTVISTRLYLGTTIYEGRPAIIGAVIDVTKEKNLELQLRQAQKMEAIGTMAGGVAHDFNNILTVLTGYGTLLEMGMEQNDPRRVYVEQILTASHKAASLTRSLLAFSRREKIALAPANLNDLVRANETLLRRLLPEDISLQTILCEQKIAIMADAVQIDQMLLNLATNARDAMPKGGTLRIETKLIEADNDFALFHDLEGPGTYTLLSVSDTGVGMSEELKEKIFEPFFTTKELGKGTGLGLSAVYGAVKQHHGQISVYSEPDLGTTFHIYLPVAAVPDKQEQVLINRIRGGVETIMVAEDNPDVRGLIRNILEECGYTVIEAIDGVEAVEKYQDADHVDLLILDSIMPKLSGRQAYDEICKMEPDIKVLFTSGYTKDTILDKGIEMGQFDFISKPLVPNELLKKVRDILDR